VSQIMITSINWRKQITQSTHTSTGYFVAQMINHHKTTTTSKTVK